MWKGAKNVFLFNYKPKKISFDLHDSIGVGWNTNKVPTVIPQLKLILILNEKHSKNSIRFLF